jgi:hypothetical protein
MVRLELSKEELQILVEWTHKIEGEFGFPGDNEEDLAIKLQEALKEA